MKNTPAVNCLFWLVLLGAALFGCEPSTREAGKNPDVELQPAARINPSNWPALTNPFGESAEIEAEIETLLAAMSLEEKIGQMVQAEIQSLEPGDVKKYHLGSVLNGGGSWPKRNAHATAGDWLALADSFYEESLDNSDGKVGIPIIWGTDAVHGHNNVIGATLFPHNIGLGAARNAALVESIGEATATEVRATGIDWTFAPTLAVARNNAWGRSYESYSENPALVAELGEAMVKGLQGEPGAPDFLAPHRVVATAKHFVGDGATWRGDDQGDARVSEQVLIDIHNAGYPPAITAGVQTVMASFSAWHGTKMHGNEALLTQVLKQRMNFDGLVVGDWNGHAQLKGCSKQSCAQAINAGIDLVMVPYDWKAFISNTLAQVASGEIELSRIDDAVRRILRVKLRAGLFDSGKPSERAPAAQEIGNARHRALARQAVRESLVLLKNRNRTLPLLPNQKLLVVGPAARSIAQQSGGWSISWQGSGMTNDKFPGATSIYSGIEKAVRRAGGTLTYSENGTFEERPDAAIVVFGEQPYAEGLGDRDTLEFQPGNKEALLKLQALRDQGIPVVSVFLSGRPMWVNPELNASDAFVSAWLPGSEGAGVADVILADTAGNPRYNFTGRLPFSWPAGPLDTEVNIGDSPYEPLFPFGYGLDYSHEGEGPGDALEERPPGIATGEVPHLNFYVGRPLQPWNLFLESGANQEMLSGAYAALSDGSMTLTATDKDVQEDALNLVWNQPQQGQLVFRGDAPLNLVPFQSGTLEFDIRVKDLERGGLELGMSCGEQCLRRVPIDVDLRRSKNAVWQKIRLSMRCFLREGEIFDAVQRPFVLDVGGRGEVAIANIVFHKRGEASTPCPDYRSVAVTPAKLEKYWALDWWLPRHEQVLQRISQAPVDLIMIGDSITHWWEKDAPEVWQEYYGQRNAVNMGFAGDRTENVLWRLQNGALEGISPKVAVLLIGTNNTGHRLQPSQYTVAGIQKILDTLREKLPDTKVLLLAIFPRGASPQSTMRVINEQINKSIAEFADDRHVFFLNINAQFLDEQGVLSEAVAPDLLHLNEASYRRWAEAMEPMLKRLW